MQDAIAIAIDNRDFRTAATLLQQWKQTDPNDPNLLLMVGRYQEATGRWEQAEKTYLRLLRQSAGQKLMAQARQGIQRVQIQIAKAREEALETARSQPDGQDLGILCLEPVQGDKRTVAAQGLAKIMDVDAYTARLQFPSKGLRLYRIGSVGDLQYYSRALSDAAAPSFWVKHADITAIQVFNVRYFRRVQPRAEVVCQNADNQTGSITFDWSEVSQVVLGQVPIFESVVDTGIWHTRQRKEKTQDYAEVVDLQFHQRRCILRLCDRTYDFRQSNPLPNADTIPDKTISTRPRWQALIAYIRDRIQTPTHDSFASFGEGALEFIDLLPFMNHRMELARVKDSNWDAAFHLYSGLHFTRHSQSP